MLNSPYSETLGLESCRLTSPRAVGSSPVGQMGRWKQGFCPMLLTSPIEFLTFYRLQDWSFIFINLSVKKHTVVINRHFCFPSSLTHQKQYRESLCRIWIWSQLSDMLSIAYTMQVVRMTVHVLYHADILKKYQT